MGNGKSAGKRLTVARRKEAPVEKEIEGQREGARGSRYCWIIQRCWRLVLL